VAFRKKWVSIRWAQHSRLCTRMLKVPVFTGNTPFAGKPANCFNRHRHSQHLERLTFSLRHNCSLVKEHKRRKTAKTKHKALWLKALCTFSPCLGFWADTPQVDRF
jgi:hypothetical protein